MRVGLAVVGALVLASCQLGLGGPNDTFGNDPTSAGGNVGMWASISGPFTRHQDGDPYTTMCSGDTVTPSTCDTTSNSGGPPMSAATAQNPDYDPSGYSWMISIPNEDVGHAVTVQIYDPAVSSTGSPLFESSGTPTSDFHTSYELFDYSGDVNNVLETPALSMNGKCSEGPGYQVFGFGTSSGAPDYFESWYTLCTFTPTRSGFYPLQVKTSDIPGVADAGTGWNAYSVRATAAGGGLQPTVSALNKISIVSTPSGPITSMYLANVLSQYAGHTLVVDLFDPGDGVGASAFTVQLESPPSGLVRVPTGGNPVACNYNATPSPLLGASTPDTSGNCTITTKLAGASGGIYNNAWLRMVVTIPSTYHCTTDCWWWLRFNWATDPPPVDRGVIIANVSTS
jgi:hypothetical protein